MNATATCRLCLRSFDKGVPADPTQDDSTFVCAACATIEGGYPQDARRSTREELSKYRSDIPPAVEPGRKSVIGRLVNLLRGK